MLSSGNDTFIFPRPILTAFETCMREGNAGSIMYSYSAVNGVPSCANSFLQNTIIREKWGFEGYIVL